MIDFLLGILPILVLIVLLTKPRPVPSCTQPYVLLAHDRLRLVRPAAILP